MAFLIDDIRNAYKIAYRSEIVLQQNAKNQKLYDNIFSNLIFPYNFRG